MKVFLDTVGCRLNQAEIEKYARQFRAAGHQVVSSPGEADLAVLNTCTVTSAAASDSRQKIHQIGRNPGIKIYLTGCLATLDPENLNSFPGVDGCIFNPGKDHLVEEILDLSIDRLQGVLREPVAGKRQRTRAFIKAQDGCDQHCTYCITRVARGKSRSIPSEIVIEDIIASEEGHVKEVVLCGVQLGSWGRDFSPKKSIVSLLKDVLLKTRIPRIRLSSIEPWDLDEEFFDLWRNPRVCRQLHMPLQSGAQETLRRMGRKNSPADYLQYVMQARQVSPEIAITTDIMVGFPGETDKEFKDSLEFVEDMKFAGGHVFVFSPRSSTPAEKMKDQVPMSIRKNRSQAMRKLLESARNAYRATFLGKDMDVLWETGLATSENKWIMKGLTDNYLKVTCLAGSNRWNELDRVRLLSLTPSEMLGEIIN